MNILNKFQNKKHKKWVSYLYRIAQPPTLAPFLAWGSSAGADRTRLTHHKTTNTKLLLQIITHRILYAFTKA